MLYRPDAMNFAFRACPIEITDAMDRSQIAAVRLSGAAFGSGAAIFMSRFGVRAPGGNPRTCGALERNLLAPGRKGNGEFHV